MYAFYSKGGGGSTQINEMILHFYGQKWIPGTQKHIFTYKTYQNQTKNEQSSRSLNLQDGRRRHLGYLTISELYFILYYLGFFFYSKLSFKWGITRPYQSKYGFYLFSGSAIFPGAIKMGSGGQKNWPPFFSCFIYPKVPLYQKSQNEHENLAKKHSLKHYIPEVQFLMQR